MQLLIICFHINAVTNSHIMRNLKIYNIYIILGMQPSSCRIRYIRITSHQILEEYEQRAKAPIPNTPQISLGEQNGQLLTLFVEELDQKNIVDQLKENNLDYKLFFFHQIIFTFLKLRQKYGCFRIDHNFIKMNQNNQPRVWLHRDPIMMSKQFPLPDSPNSELIMINGIYTIFKQIIFNLDSLDRCDTLKELLSEVCRMINKMSCISTSAKQDLQNGEKKQIGNFLKEKFRKHRQSNYTPIQKPKYQHSKSFLLSESIINIKKSSFLNGNNLTKTGQTQGKNKTITDPKSVQLEAKRLIQKIKHTSKAHIQEQYSSIKTQRHPNQIKNSNIQLEKQSPFSGFRPKYSQIINPNQHDIPGSMIAQQTKQDQEQKQRVFQRSKFPYSTESTFVTLKQTKSFGQIPPYFETQIQAIPIQQQKSSQNKASSNQKSENALCESQHDLQNDFESLFLGDEPDDREQINQEEYVRRQCQFSQILFS